MPYILQSQRQRLDPAIAELEIILCDLCEPKGGPDVAADGMLNYIFTRLLQGGPLQSYVSLERAVGCLECCKLELYRRVAAPYEDKKAEENGEVYP